MFKMLKLTDQHFQIEMGFFLEAVTHLNFQGPQLAADKLSNSFHILWCLWDWEKDWCEPPHYY